MPSSACKQKGLASSSLTRARTVWAPASSRVHFVSSPLRSLTDCSTLENPSSSLRLAHSSSTAIATAATYALSLHAALPICTFTLGFNEPTDELADAERVARHFGTRHSSTVVEDRKSTRLNSSHSQNSYAVFCLQTKRLGQQLPDPRPYGLGARVIACPFRFLPAPVLDRLLDFGESVVLAEARAFFFYCHCDRCYLRPFPTRRSSDLHVHARLQRANRRARRRRARGPTLRHAPQLDRRRRSEEHTSELQSQSKLVCRLLLANKKAWPAAP